MNCALGPFCDLDACAEPSEASGINGRVGGHPATILTGAPEHYKERATSLHKTTAR